MRSSFFSLALSLMGACVLVSAARSDELPPQFDRFWTDARFFDVDHGYVYSRMGPSAFIATDDGGATWRVVLDFPAGDPKGAMGNFVFLSRDRFFVDSFDHLRFTHDAGATFATLPPVLSLDMFFLNETKGWTVGENVRTTSDGGRSWQNYPADDPFLHSALQIVMFSADEGILLTGRGVAQTADGGKSWHLEAGSPHPSMVSCLNSGFCAAAADHGPISFSTDRGLTWTNAGAPILPGGQDEIRVIQAVSPTLVVAAGIDIGINFDAEIGDGEGDVPPHAPPRALLLKWNGSTWTRSTYAEPDRFWGVNFIDANNGWFPAGHNSLYKTTDGGQSLIEVKDYFRQIYELTPTPTPLVEPTPTQ